MERISLTAPVGPKRRSTPTSTYVPPAEQTERRFHQLTVALFTRQLATMMGAGVSIVPALAVLEAQEDKLFGEIVNSLARMVAEGHRLSQAASRFPLVFDRVYLTQLEIGERTGRLHLSLERLADWLERDFRLRKKVLSALTYPLFIVSLTVGLTLFLALTILPGFVKIFEDMRVPLPLLTQGVLELTRMALNPGYWLVGAGGIWLAVLWLRAALSDPAQLVPLYRAVTAIPILGPLLRTAGVVRFCYAMESLLQGGCKVYESLPMSAHSSGSPLLLQHAPQAAEKITQGQTLHQVLAESPELYPSTLAGLVAVGEETANLDTMFGRCAQLFGEDLEFRLDALSSMLEPVLVGIVALVVGTIVLAIFIPLYSYIGSLSS